MKNIFIEDYNKSKSEEIYISPSDIFQKATKSIPKEINYYELHSNEKNNLISKIAANHIYIIKLNDSLFTNLYNLSSLNLSHNIISEFPKKITNLKNLKYLNLSNNILSQIPSYLKDLPELEELYLSHNSISNISSTIQNFKNLKILDISYNKITYLPIEIGFIKELLELDIFNNYFTEIPSSICYLKNLKNIKLEWFEFLDPPQTSDMLDEDFILSLKTILKSLINQSKLYCDFSTFLLQLSQNIQNKIKDNSFNSFETEKAECFKYNSNDIFYALENEYLGVIKSLIQSDDNNLKIKNQTGKTILYIAIQQGKKDIYDYLLSKINFRNISNPNIYIHKAIRTRNYNLLVKLYLMGADFNSIDEKANNCYHVLGKNDWTPLHLSLHSYKYNESILLIKMGSSLFDRTEDGKRMKNITNNFFLTKMLNQKIERFYDKKYGDNNNENNNNQNKNNDNNNNNQNIIENNNNSFINNYKNVALESTRNEILLNSEYSLMERYHSLMLLNLNNNPKEVESIIMEIFQQIKIINSKFSIIFVEICQIIEKFQFTSFLNFLIQILNSNNSITENSFVSKQLNNTINYLKKINEDKFIKYNLYKSIVNTENLLGNTIQFYELNNSMLKNEESILQNEDFFYEMNKSINNEQKINYYNGNNDNQGNFFKLEQKTISDNSENGEEIQTIEQENEIGS